MPNTIVKKLAGTVVYELGRYGQYAGAKRGQRCCWKKVITDSFTSGYGGKMVGDNGLRRLVLNGVKSKFTAKQVQGGYELSSSLSLTPVGDVLG